MRKKKIKIKGIEEALLKLSEAQREEARGAVLDVFKDFDPTDPPGKAVENLARGQASCTRCGHPATLLPGDPITLPDGEVVQLAECDPCDQPYFVPPLN